MTGELQDVGKTQNKVSCLIHWIQVAHPVTHLGSFGSCGD